MCNMLHIMLHICCIYFMFMLLVCFVYVILCYMYALHG